MSNGNGTGRRRNPTFTEGTFIQIQHPNILRDGIELDDLFGLQVLVTQNIGTRQKMTGRTMTLKDLFEKYSP